MIMKKFQSSFIFSLMGLSFVSLSMGMDRTDRATSLDTAHISPQFLEVNENTLKRKRDDFNDSAESPEKRQKVGKPKVYQVKQNTSINDNLNAVSLSVDDFLADIFASVKSDNIQKDVKLCQDASCNLNIVEKSENVPKTLRTKVYKVNKNMPVNGNLKPVSRSVDDTFSDVVISVKFDNGKKEAKVCQASNAKNKSKKEKMDHYESPVNTGYDHYEDTRRYYNSQEMRAFQQKEFNSYLKQGMNLKDEKGVDCLYRALHNATYLDDWGLQYKIHFLLWERNIRRSPEHLLKAYNLAKQNKSKWRQFEALVQMGDKRIEDPMECYLKALMISQMANNMQLQCVARMRLGNYYFEERNNQKAFDSYKKALQLSEKMKDKYFQCSAHLKLGDYYYLEERNNRKAFNSYKKAHTLAQKLSQKETALRGMKKASQK